MGPAVAPHLETARLTLRPFRATDVAAQAAMMGDGEVMRHLGGQPIAREDAWRKLLNGAGLWSLFGYGYWAVERRSDGAPGMDRRQSEAAQHRRPGRALQQALRRIDAR